MSTAMHSTLNPRMRSPSAMTLRKLVSHALLVVILLIGSACPIAAQEKAVALSIKPTEPITPQPADDAPLAFPPLDHYSRLWENSLFTSRSLPPPDTEPKGPVFTDNLTLVGIYEVDGTVVGVVLDRTTSQVIEIRIGSENESGIKIVRVSPGATPDKTRLQLQKGEEFGWVTFADAPVAPADASAPGAPNPNATPNPNQPNHPGSAIPGRPVIPQPPQPGQPPASLRPVPPQRAPSSPLNPNANVGPAAVPPPMAAPAGGDVPLPPQ